MTSNAQIAANQLNSQSSTGPSSVEGKTRSSRNALDLGIYTRKFHILDHENADHYGAYLRASFNYWRPADQLQIDYVAELVNLQWEIWRYRAAEPEIILRYALNHSLTEHEAYIQLLMDPKTNPLKYLLRLRARSEARWATRVKDLQKLQKTTGTGGPSGSGDLGPSPDLVTGVPQGAANPLCDETGFVPKLALIGGDQTSEPPDIAR